MVSVAAFEPIVVRLAIVVHMPNGQLDRSAVVDYGFEPAHHTAFLA
jgi:hypothetical protein